MLAGMYLWFVETHIKINYKINFPYMNKLHNDIKVRISYIIHLLHFIFSIILIISIIFYLSLYYLFLYISVKCMDRNENYGKYFKTSENSQNSEPNNTPPPPTNTKKELFLGFLVSIDLTWFSSLSRTCLKKRTCPPAFFLSLIFAFVSCCAHPYNIFFTCSSVNDMNHLCSSSSSTLS